jgi:hypothetical protein
MGAHCNRNHSALPLLVTGIGADHAHHPVAPDDLAVAADRFTDALTFMAGTVPIQSLF